MANQIIIDIGAAANDGTGDPLRTAFNYVNNNFSNVWNTGLPESNVVFSGNRILTANTNGNLVLAPNGTGRVVANVDIVPNANNTLNLGSLTRQWNTVYSRNISISGELTSGDLTVNGNLTVSGDIIEMGNIITDAKTIQLANTANSTATANLSGITVGANDNIATFLYNATANAWTTNIGVSAAGNISGTYFIGNGSLLTGIAALGNLAISGSNIQLAANVANTDIYIAPSGSTSNAYVRIPDNASSLADGLAVVNRYGRVEISAKDGAAIQTWYFREDGSFELPGDVDAHIKSDQDIIIQTGSGDHWTFGSDNTLTTPGNLNPDTSNVYSLGNATNQWSDLWVSNATIYMNSVPISLAAGNVLTVNGEDVVTTNANGQANIGNLDITGTYVSIASGADETLITISPNIEGQAYLQIPNDATANAYDVRMHNDAGNIELGTGSGSYNWYFDNTGNLTIPNGGYINFVNTGGITQAVNEDLRFTVSDDEQDGWAIQSTVNDGAGTDLTRMQVRYDGVQINTDLPTNNHNWTFRDSGEFDVPGPIRGPYGGNLVISIGDQFGSTTFIDLQTRSYVGDALISNIRIGDPNVTVSTASGAYNWTFGSTGNLTLPPSGNIVGATANNSGRIQWLGNSSGDGNGYTTLRLVPDDTLEGNDQYLIIDPTAPGHIHIRAGGTQDNSSADLFLGGENSYFKVNAGANNEVRISANSHAWVFGADSILTVPGEGIIRSIQDTVILQSVDVYGNTYSARLGTTGGLYLETTDYANGWLYLTNDSGNANINSPSGDINIVPAFGVANGPGHNVNINGGDADQSDYYTGTGGAVNITGGLGGFNDGGGGGPGGNVNITAGNSSDPAGHAGNVNISAGVNDWVFDYNGNLILPSNSFAVNYANGTPVSLGGNYGDSNVASFLAAYGSNTVSTTGNITAGNFLGAGSNVDIVAGAYDWAFGNDGNLTLPGNTFAVNYANGTPVSLGGSSYGNANVVANLAALGSNPISSTGNITTTANVSAGNLISSGTFQSSSISSTGNLVASGNVVSGLGGNNNFVLGNVNSRLTATASNSYITMDQNPTIVPDTSKSALAGIVIGGNGYLLAANGARVLTLNGNNSLTVAGNLAIGGSTGFSRFTTLGDTTTGVNAIVAGQSPTILANSSATFAANVNNYTQITFQNRSTGADATADYILTADNGSDTVNYGDFGIINSGYDNSTPTNSLGNIVFAADTYIYAQGNVSNTSQSGGNLVIGTATAGKTVKIFAGGNTASALVANISNTGISVTGNVTASNFIGNISITGNVTGTSANVQLVAGSYTTTFDNLGVATFPGNISVTGNVITPNLPAFRVYGNGVTSVSTTTNTTGKLNGNNWAVDYNQGSYLNSSTGTFTAPVAGLYQVNLNARVANNSGSASQVIVYKNYGVANAVQVMWETAANCTVNHFGVGTVSKLAVGDTLSLVVTVGQLTFDANDSWSVAFLG